MKIHDLMFEPVCLSVLTVTLTTVDIEFCFKIFSLSVSTGYVIYRWAKDLKKNKDI